MFARFPAKLTFKAAALSAFVLLLCGTTNRLDQCEGDLLCGFERPEDISILPGTNWALVSQHGDPTLVWVDLRTGERHAASTNNSSDPPLFGAADCTDPPEAMVTRGNTMAAIAGAQVAAVINASAANPRIEFFRVQLDADKPRSQWAGCVGVPKHLVLNDLALTADGVIFATHMYDPPGDQAGFEDVMRKFRDAEDTGYVVRWNRKEGWQKVVGTTMSFPNGVAISSSGERLAIGGTFEQALTIIDLDAGNIGRVDLPLQPDNITALSGDAFLATGHTGVPVTGVDGCRPPDAVPCGFPFATAEVSSELKVTIRFAHDGSAIPGASVAVPWRGGLILGSAYGDRLTKVPFWMLTER